MSDSSDSGTFFGCALLIVFLGYGLVQIGAGYIGIEHHFSGFWAGAAVFVAIFLRFMLPLTVGSFFCALNVWGWHWFWALIFAAPGLLFMALMIPGFLQQMRQRSKF